MIILIIISQLADNNITQIVTHENTIETRKYCF